MKIYRIAQVADGDVKLKLFGELKNNLYGQFDLRIYQSKLGWHLGFPQKMMTPLCPVLETEPYLGETRWKEDGGFWIWKTECKTKAELSHDLETWYLPQIDEVVKLIQKWHKQEMDL